MEEKIKNYHLSGRSKGMVFGLIMVVIGGLLLGLNFGLFNEAIKPVVFSWPMILIVIGLFQLANRHYFSTFVLFSIGVFFLIPKIAIAYPSLFPGIAGASFTAVYWPVLLIVAGVLFLLHFLFPTNNWHRKWHNKWNQTTENDESHTYDFGAHSGGFDKNVVFGSIEQIVLDEEFPGGEVNAVFGGITLDLRKTKLAPGDTYLEINAVFGGITLYIPDEWYVVTKMDTVFGGFDDKRLKIGQVDKTRRLIVKGSCVFGGGEIK
ncbi:MAG: DUF5668 domain-containing protein [Paludibacteraceae bacterium]